MGGLFRQMAKNETFNFLFMHLHPFPIWLG
jgi:hypothetical protein